jgi:hypothetical protein
MFLSESLLIGSLLWFLGIMLSFHSTENVQLILERSLIGKRAKEKYRGTTPCPPISLKKNGFESRKC